MDSVTREPPGRGSTRWRPRTRTPGARLSQSNARPSSSAVTTQSAGGSFGWWTRARAPIRNGPTGRPLLDAGQDHTVERCVLPHDQPYGRAEYDRGPGNVAENRLAGEPDRPGDQETADHRRRDGDRDPEPVQPGHRARLSH